MAIIVLRWIMKPAESFRCQRAVPFQALMQRRVSMTSHCGWAEVRLPQTLKMRPPDITLIWGMAAYHGVAMNWVRNGPRATVSFDCGLLSGPWYGWVHSPAPSGKALPTSSAPWSPFPPGRRTRTTSERGTRAGAITASARLSAREMRASAPWSAVIRVPRRPAPSAARRNAASGAASSSWT